MSRIADKHGLTNKYRPIGSKRHVKCGRPRKHLFGYSKPKPRRSAFKTSSKQSQGYNVENYTTVNSETSKIISVGCTVIVGIIIVAIILIAIANSEKKPTKQLDVFTINQSGHPQLFADYDSFKEYYSDYTNVSVGSYQVHPEVEAAVLTGLSYLDYDTIYLITLNLSNLEKEFTLAEAIDIALDYIPTDIVLECFEFEKAIFKTKSEGTQQYECYYIQKKSGVKTPGYYYFDDGSWIKMKSGFSIVIQETINNSYVIEVGDKWYDFVYDSKPAGGESGPSKEEMESHKEWDFSIEKYLESK